MSYVLIVLGVGAVVGASGVYKQSNEKKSVAEYNALIAEQQAVDATEQGEKDSQQARREANQMIGAQRAAFSARGVDISEGSAADLIDQTDFFGQMDQTTARKNAAKKAWNIRANKAGYQYEADNTNPSRNAGLSLLSSAGSVAGSYYGKKG